MESILAITGATGSEFSEIRNHSCTQAIRKKEWVLVYDLPFTRHRIEIRTLERYMGIDIYAHWKGQTPKQKQEQMTGFSVAHGHVGYLREAYHGNPYATHYLFQEVFAKKGEAKIPAKILRERLPRTLEIVEERECKIYKQMRKKQIDRIKRSFIDFVKLCEEKEKKTKEPCTIVANY